MFTPEVPENKRFWAYFSQDEKLPAISSYFIEKRNNLQLFQDEGLRLFNFFLPDGKTTWKKVPCKAFFEIVRFILPFSGNCRSSRKEMRETVASAPKLSYNNSICKKMRCGASDNDSDEKEHDL